MKAFFTQAMVSDDANSFSPSAAKPGLVITDLISRGILKADDVLNFEPVDRETLYLAHDPDFVDGVLDCQIDNGFGNRSADIARSLRHTVGSMVAAAEHAIIHNEHTLSPSSGFHHAGYDFAGGYCTFNGLIVAAMALREAGLVDRVAILDCDHHHGNGTSDIIQRKKLKWITHATAGARFDHTSKTTDYFKWLDNAIRDMEHADLVLYQAGADPHVNDPLGGLLTTEQLAHRDDTVRWAFDNQPLVWNLAGGYQRDALGTIEPVLEIHRNTARIFSS